MGLVRQTNMLNFVISIAMLFGGLKIAQSIGGAAGGMAGKGIGAISKGVVKPMAAGAMGAYAFSKRKAIAGAVGTGKFKRSIFETGFCEHWTEWWGLELIV